MLIVNAKKDEAISLTAAKKIMILPSINSKGYDVCAILAENGGFNFYAGIERDYETVQKIFLWLVKNQSSKKTVVVNEAFIIEVLEEELAEEIQREREGIPHK